MEIYQCDEGLIKSFNNLAGKYDEITEDFTHKIIEYIHIQNMSKELPILKNRLNLLDLGGGTGKYSIILSKMGYNVTLVDISEKSLKIAEDKIKKENLSINIINSSGEKLPFGNETFDIIVMTGGVINYTPKPEKLLLECKRILNKKGILYFDFMNNIGWANEINDLKYRLEIIESESKIIKMDDWDYPVQLFNNKFMEKMIEKSGFKIKSKYGLLNITTSLPLDIRYSNKYEDNILEKYKIKELEISRDNECYGTSSSCIIVGIV